MRCFCKPPYGSLDCSIKMNTTTTVEAPTTDYPVLVDAMGNTLSSRKPKVIIAENTTESIFVGGMKICIISEY